MDSLQGAPILTGALPKNVNLLTYEPFGDNKILVRFEHLLEKKEDIDGYSKVVKFDMEDIFKAFEISKIEETTLAANQFKKTSLAKRFKFEAENETEIRQKTTSRAPKKFNEENDFVVELAPMEIKTFILTIEWKPTK